MYARLLTNKKKQFLDPQTNSSVILNLCLYVVWLEIYNTTFKCAKY